MRWILRKELILGNALNQLPNPYPILHALKAPAPLPGRLSDCICLNVSFILINTEYDQAIVLEIATADFFTALFVDRQMARVCEEVCLKSLLVNSVCSDNGATHCHSNPYLPLKAQTPARLLLRCSIFVSYDKI